MMTARDWLPPGARPRLLLGALLLLGPLLLFPSPDARWSLVTPWLAMAIAITGTLDIGNRTLRLLVAWFCVSVGAAWWGTPWDDASALRHFSGVALGVLVMVTVASVCDSQRNLALASAVFCLGSVALLAVGLISTRLDRAKLIDVVLSNPVRLGLPGMIESGYVNPNALGGTAILIAPAALAIALIPWSSFRRAWMLSVLGWLLSSLTLFVLLLTQSRSAWAAGLLTILVLGWQRGRNWRVRALTVIGVAILSIAVIGTVRELSGNRFDAIVKSSLRSGVDRTQLWGVAVDQLAQSAWLGIGIDQFRRINLDPPKDFEMDEPYWHSPHVHNIFLQVLLDVGLVGGVPYVLLLVVLLRGADRAAQGPRRLTSCVATGMGLSLVAVHCFGLADAVALGAKVGLLQWFAAGLALSASGLAGGEPRLTSPSASGVFNLTSLFALVDRRPDEA